MAIVSNPLIGKSKQSAGGVTFTSWKGRNVLKNKATSVANPKTPAQIANRNRLSGATKFYAKHRIPLMPAFVRMMGDVTDSNKFVSLNRLCFLDTMVKVNPVMLPSMILASGSLGTISVGEVTKGGVNSTLFTFTYASNPLQATGDDWVALVVYNESADELTVTQWAITEGSQSHEADSPSAPGNIMHGWVYAYSAVGKKLSDSFYCGSYTVV